MKYNLFIFHRDLRIIDNIALTYLYDNGIRNIIPIFIFTPEQISSKNKYKSANAIQFMISTLKELSKKIKINYYEKNIIIIKFYFDELYILIQKCRSK